ncbi:MAG: DUF4159 domain-containing protein [Alphaproteobacteria bacterium]|nr:DUF4159 domain-containing protein [Alphaproteobacteria bacterium]
MLTLGSLAFASPWLLTALAVLPVIWLLLRVTPPAPRRLNFPAIRILHLLTPKEETPARTPWWLVLLRLLIAALVILGLSEPLLNPSARLAGDGPVVIALDDTWAAAPRWEDRRRVLLRLIEDAEQQSRQVVLLTTSEGVDEARRSSGVVRPTDARALVQAMEPRPWGPDMAATAAALDKLQLPSAGATAYLVDGLDHGAGQVQLIERLQRLGRLTAHLPAPPQVARALMPPDGLSSDLVVGARRPIAGAEAEVAVRAIAGDGRLIAREAARFAADGIKTEVKFVLPTELRNQVQRLEIENEPSAAAVVLLDERWRRRPVGLIGPTQFDASQPLLDELHYLDKALAPFAEVRRGPVAELLKRELAVILLPDAGALPPADKAQLAPWIEAGGVLMRFAGPKLANAEDDLVPVKLRKGDRALGGALSWNRPQPLAPFETASPFAGLAVPTDVTVQRQVLAQPGLELNERTWARLADGTPIVTGERRGLGWNVLVHTTAIPTWSNLPMSGLFVDMLRRVVALSQGVTGSVSTQPLPPIETLDGFGRITAPPPSAVALVGDARVGSRNPPGFYGTESARRALNLGPFVADAAALTQIPNGVTRASYAIGEETVLKPHLLTAALLLLLIDIVIGLVLRGLMPGRVAAARAAIALLALLPIAAEAQTRNPPSRANAVDAFALEGTLNVRLAYVITGDARTDETSRLGLEGLTHILQRRTAIEPDGPLGVDVEADELAFFALIYWPMTQSQAMPSPSAMQRLNTYLKNSGTIVFDTRDAGEIVVDPFAGGPGAQKLREIARGLSIPALVPAPPEHVLTKAFYLLNDFPGRFASGQLWVEATRAQGEDEVSSVILGSNDWAGAWASDAGGRALYAVVPGGEIQREMAFRFGVNLVMYALTGNYKADQVHVPAILERFGQ